jgi:prevent-host-death family protein
MARTLNATEAKRSFLALLDEVEDGEEIEITRRGRTIARLLPARGPAALRGSMRGIAWTVRDDDDLLSTGIRWEVEGDEPAP